MAFRRLFAFAHQRGARFLPLASLAAASGAASGGGAGARCDVFHTQREDAHDNLMKARHVVCLHKHRIGASLEDDGAAFSRSARKAFSSFAGEDGTLTMIEMESAVALMSCGLGDDSLPWELGPLLLRLMDVNHDGHIDLNEFIIGQQLLQAAAQSKDSGADAPTSGEIAELCWRALDVDGDGQITRNELAVMVRLMLHLGAVDEHAMKEIKFTWAKNEMWNAHTGMGKSSTVPREAIDYYMHMYDLDGDGLISKEEFSKCNLLQRNFWNLLTKPEVQPIFIARGFGGHSASE